MLPELLGTEGTPLGFEYKGKKYTFKPLSIGILEELEVRHFEQAKKRLKDMKDVLDEDTYTKKGLDLYEQYEAGEFGFFSTKGQKWVKKPAGAFLLLKLSLDVSDEELLPLLLAKSAEINQLMQVVLSESGLTGQARQAGQESGEAPFRFDTRNP